MQSSVNYLVLRIEKGFKKKSRYFTELLDLVTSNVLSDLCECQCKVRFGDAQS